MRRRAHLLLRPPPHQPYRRIYRRIDAKDVSGRPNAPGHRPLRAKRRQIRVHQNGMLSEFQREGASSSWAGSFVDNPLGHPRCLLDSASDRLPTLPYGVRILREIVGAFLMTECRVQVRHQSQLASPCRRPRHGDAAIGCDETRRRTIGTPEPPSRLVYIGKHGAGGRRTGVVIHCPGTAVASPLHPPSTFGLYQKLLPWRRRGRILQFRVTSLLDGIVLNERQKIKTNTFEPIVGLQQTRISNRVIRPVGSISPISIINTHRIWQGHCIGHVFARDSAPRCHH